MENYAIPSSILLVGILLLTFLSAYFASSETAMMKLNLYKLKHLKSEGHRGAKRADKLLKRQDQLLGVILICNNLVNNCAALIAGVVCVRFFGDVGYGIAAVGLTIFFLIFAEIAPKTVAAERPEMIAYPSSFLLQPLIQILRPLVVAVNWLSIGFVRPLISKDRKETQTLSVEELRTVLGSDVEISDQNRDMLLALTYLQSTTVEDVMIPRAEVHGIDIEDSANELREQIVESVHTRLPVYKGSLDTVVGLLHVRRAVRFLSQEEFSAEDIERELREPYFVPDSTGLSKQLLEFQEGKERMAFVVDEYGEVTGLITLEDIVEEVVGEFVTSSTKVERSATKQADGSYLVEGASQIRDINAHLNWNLPTDKSKTLNGLILQELAEIPDANVSLRINEYLIETVQVSDAGIRTVKIRREAPPPEDQEDATEEDG